MFGANAFAWPYFGQAYAIVVSSSISDTLLLTQTSSFTLAKDATADSLALSQTNAWVAYDDAEVVFLAQTSSPTLLEQVNGSVDDVLRLLVTNDPEIAETIVSPVVVDTLDLSATNTQVVYDDADTLRLTQTHTQLELPGVELAQLSQANTPAADDEAELVQLSQTNSPSIADIVVPYSPDDPRLTQRNVPSLTEVVVSPPIFPPPRQNSGIEYNRIILPYTKTSYTLARDLKSGYEDETIYLVDASALPAGGFVLFVDSEMVFVKSRDGNALAVVRGWSATLPYVHFAGATVEWRNYYDMVMDAPYGAPAGRWIVMCDATQAYLNGQRYAFHASQFLHAGPPGGVSKLDGPQPWRASPTGGLTDNVPGGICQPARVRATITSDDTMTVRYLNDVAPTGVFELGPRAILPQLVISSDPLTDAFSRYDAAGNDVTATDPNGNIYDGQTSSGRTYTDSAVLVRARELGADRYWTQAVSTGGKGKTGVNIGVLTLRNGISNIPGWTSPDWYAGDSIFMGFDDPDSMFLQVVYRAIPVPNNLDIYGPDASWTVAGFRTSAAFATFTSAAPGSAPPGGGSGGGNTGGGTGGSGSGTGGGAQGGGGLTKPVGGKRHHHQVRF